jgi:hypothetical protein
VWPASLDIRPHERTSFPRRSLFIHVHVLPGSWPEFLSIAFSF